MSQGCDIRCEIETPENVLLSFQLAGPGSRFAAFLIDLTIRWGVAFAIIVFSMMIIPLFGEGMPIGAMLVSVFLLEWGYPAFFEGLWRGQTPGKRAMGIRVVKDVGYPISFYDAVLRNLLRAADMMPGMFGVGLFCMASTKKFQRIGDLVAGTMVICESRHRFRRRSEYYRDLDPLLPIECEGRFHVSDRTLDTIEQLLHRKDDLSRDRLEEIARILSIPIAKKLGCEKPERRRHVFFLRRILRTFAEADLDASSAKGLL